MNYILNLIHESYFMFYVRRKKKKYIIIIKKSCMYVVYTHAFSDTHNS
jgi:hypothetical protein